MKLCKAAAAALVISACAFAQTASTTPARKSCEDLKSELAKKLDAKGAANYTLDVVDKGKEGDGKVIGSCDGGTKSIVYSRGAEKKPSEPKKPQ
jgi:hypothetical protein